MNSQPAANAPGWGQVFRRLSAQEQNESFQAMDQSEIASNSATELPLCTNSPELFVDRAPYPRTLRSAISYLLLSDRHNESLYNVAQAQICEHLRTEPKL